jgi:hypothetical protein
MTLMSWVFPWYQKRLRSGSIRTNFTEGASA